MSTNSEIARALQQIRPGAAWGLTGNDYSKIIWSDAIQTKPSQAEIDSTIAGFAAADAAEATRKASITGDAQRAAMLQRLKTASSSQIDSWLTANVTNLSQARDVLGAILKLIALDQRQ